MYRTHEEYERMVDLATSIIEDYGITANDYPLDMDKLYKKMRIQSIPYSAFDSNQETIALLMKRSADGFYVPRSSASDLTVYFNDQYADKPPTKQRISQTKAHELKHIFEEDSDDSEDDLCDYFGKYLRCPYPLVIYMGINNCVDLMAKFDLSAEQARYVLSNRRNSNGKRFYRKEISLLRQLLGSLFDEENCIIID